MKIFIKETFVVRCESYGSFTVTEGEVYQVIKSVGQDLILDKSNRHYLLVRSEFLEMLRTGNITFVKKEENGWKVLVRQSIEYVPCSSHGSFPITEGEVYLVEKRDILTDDGMHVLILVNPKDCQHSWLLVKSEFLNMLRSGYISLITG